MRIHSVHIFIVDGNSTITLVLEVAEHKRHAVAKLGRTVEEVVATTPRQVGYNGY